MGEEKDVQGEGCARKKMCKKQDVQGKRKGRKRKWMCKEKYVQEKYVQGKVCARKSISKQENPPGTKIFEIGFLLLPGKKLEITILAIWLSAVRTTVTSAATEPRATSFHF